MDSVTKFKMFAFVVLFSVLARGNYAHADFLKKFRENPAAAANMPVEKYMPANKKFVQEKLDACRRGEDRNHIMKQAIPQQRGVLRSYSFEPIAGHERVEEFLEVKKIVRNVNDMDKEMRTAEVTSTPWSGDYWAIRYGGAAKRYADPDYPAAQGSSDWLSSYNYVQSNPAASVEEKFLSPAEKYDRVVSDVDYTLAQASWKEGKLYNDEFGDVERWMGLCHGWAPAAFMEPRPTKTIELPVFGGEGNVSFKPNDVKALFTLKWATGVNITKDYVQNATRFLGGRCNEKDAKKDEDSGRILTPECFDLNPGTWHLAIVNHLYQEKRPLIIDASFDYEVWNQPVVSYRYMYFNPKNLERTQKLSEALIEYNDPEFKDTFAAFRKNPSAKKLVGVIMDVTYVVENNAVDVDIDSEEADAHQTARYYYDLELDENGNVLGGEWYQNRHPDFIWMPMKNSVILNHEDTILKRVEDVPRVAKEASENKLVLHAVLEFMRKKLQ